jgi:Mg2+ and Co2+ transporter CorA
VDSTIKFEDYTTYQFISLAIPEIDLNNEFNIYIGANFCLVVYPDTHNNTIVNYVKTQIITRANALNLKTENIYTPSYLASIGIDSIIAKYYEIVTCYESKIEKLLDEILVKPDELHFTTITDIRNEIYNLKKNIRAIDNININICLDEIGLIKKMERSSYKNIAVRVRGLLKFIESVYVLSNELMHTYETKISNQTNLLVTRLTVTTIIMGI